MSSNEIKPHEAIDAAPRHAAAFQFTLRQLLIAMLLLSIALAIEFGMPDWLASAAAMIVSTAIVAGLVAGIIRARGAARAFCIGALFPMSAVAIAAGGFYVFMIFHSATPFTRFNSGTNEFMYALDQTSRGWRFAVATAWPTALIAGGIAVISHVSLRPKDASH
jgi:hypothetical protein